MIEVKIKVVKAGCVEEKWQDQDSATFYIKVDKFDLIKVMQIVHNLVRVGYWDSCNVTTYILIDENFDL